MFRAVIATLVCLIAAPSIAQELRIATYNAELTRRGPGLLLNDILKRDAQVMAVVTVIAEIQPDVLHVTSMDHDLENHALSAFRALLAEAGVEYPFAYAPAPNAGLPTDVDLNSDGYSDGPRDAQGYGRFRGEGGMAVLSRFPLGEPRDFSAFLWKDLPENLAPMTANGPFPSTQARDIQRLSSVGHWEVPILVGERSLSLLVWHGTTPVFDDDKDLNGRRGADETRFWQMLLNGQLPFDPPRGPIVIAGDANIDPVDGEGLHEVIQSLLDDRRLQDPRPTSAGGTEAANPEHAGNPALDTADWPDPVPGNLRVDYVLPDAAFTVTDSGVFWPSAQQPMAEAVRTASRHRMVWVDVLFP